MGKRQPGESGIVQKVRELLEEQRKYMGQCVADVQGYTAGVNEQLMLQVGQLMTVQAALIEYLEELSTKRRDDVGAELRIKSIVEQNINRAKAEREAEAARAEASKAAEEHVMCDTVEQRDAELAEFEAERAAPADIAPAAVPADAPTTVH